MSYREQWVLAAGITLIGLVVIAVIVPKPQRTLEHRLNAIDARLDRLEASTNLLYQWSAYRAHATAQFDHIDRTNAALASELRAEHDALANLVLEMSKTVMRHEEELHIAVQIFHMINEDETRRLEEKGIDMTEFRRTHNMPRLEQTNTP